MPLRLSPALVLFLSAHWSSDQLWGGVVEWADQRTYKVTITTSLDIPKSEGVDKIRVFHTLPVENTWSEGEKGSAARSIARVPDGSRLKQDRESGGAYVEWEERVPREGGKFEFSTTYETTSARRWPSNAALDKARWRGRTVSRAPDIHPEIRQQAEVLIKENSPIEAFRKFSLWLKGRIVYDARVVNNGVDDTMLNGAGHCGHFAGVTLQFAKALGIESRPSGGSSLRLPDGGTSSRLFLLRPTWSNTHAWIELDIPGVGWVEAEPIGEDKMFEIPVHYVKTRGFTQNYRVELLKGGEWVRTEWLPRREDEGEGFYSPVGERNIISFSVLGEEESTQRGEDGVIGEAGRTGEGEELAAGADEGADGRIEPGGGATEPGRAKLCETTTFQIKRDGFLAGTVTLPAGGEVEVLNIQGDQALVKRGPSESKWVQLASLRVIDSSKHGAP